MPKSFGVAYHNPSFLASEEGRPLRILAEYSEPLQRLQAEQIQDTVVFFGSARLHTDDSFLGPYYRQARELAFRLTQWSQSLSNNRRFVICSGGGGGIMEAANRGAHEAGGRTIGFNISLPNEQEPNRFISQGLGFEFHYFFMRKLWFSYLARALIAFPGGFGTLDELFEILTLVQTRKLNRKIAIILYGSEYWRELINFDALVRYKMIDPEDLKLFHYCDGVDSAFAQLKRLLPHDKPTHAPFMARTQGGEKRSKKPRKRSSSQ